MKQIANLHRIDRSFYYFLIYVDVSQPFLKCGPVSNLFSTFFSPYHWQRNLEFIDHGIAAGNISVQFIKGEKV